MGWSLERFDDGSAGTVRAAWLQRAVAVAGLVLMAATWPLWMPHHEFPQVPWIRAAALMPVELQWLGAAGMTLGLAVALGAPSGRRLSAAGLLTFVVASAAMVAIDQQRLQPWLYQFVLVALALALVEPRAACALVRLLVVSFYFYSALSKFDYQFLHTLGQQFLDVLLGAPAAAHGEGPSQARIYLALVFPIGELLVAIGLCFAGTRRLALAGALALHGALLYMLGPWGLDHRPGVLIWNVFFMVQDVALFWIPRTSAAQADAAPAYAPRVPWPLEAIWAAAIVLPLVWTTSWFDAWPSWALYAPATERIALLIQRSEIERLPPTLLPFVELPEGENDPWANMRLDRWCLAALDAPIYPQNRFQLGVAEAVVERYQLAHRARAVRASVADRWTGERKIDVLEGLDEIVAAGGSYFFNTHPRHDLFRLTDENP